QMCKKFTVCENSMEMLVQNNLKLPKVTEEDGCFLSGFNEARARAPPPRDGSALSPERAPTCPGRGGRRGCPRCPLRPRRGAPLSSAPPLPSPQDKCLRKLSSGLFAFHTYLEYVQETFAGERQQVESLCYSTKHLASTLRQMVIDPDEVVVLDSASKKSLLAKLKSDKTWIEKITTHLILRDFTSFMEKTVRAVRYLKNTRSVSV
ncbi:IL6 protein, partial [Crypturellus undulatus]|nr:IL6 protein [Crypturellus undulatus]